MGLCGSGPDHTEPPPTGLPPLEVKIDTCSTQIDEETKSMLTKDQPFVTRRHGEMYDLISDTAKDDGLALMSTVPKMKFDEETGEETFEVLQSFFVSPSVSNAKIETICVNAVSAYDSKAGPFTHREVTRDDGLTRAVKKYTAEGWSLVATTLVRSNLKAKYVPKMELPKTYRAQIFELTFQKIAGRKGFDEYEIHEFCVETSVSMAGVSAKIPDFSPFLVDKSGKGWTLCGIACPPHYIEKNTAKLSQPVQIFLQRRHGSKPKEFALGKFQHIIKLGKGETTGDPIDFVHMWFQEGWRLRGSVYMPGQPQSTSKFAIPALFFFQSDSGGSDVLERDGPSRVMNKTEPPAPPSQADVLASKEVTLSE